LELKYRLKITQKQCAKAFQRACNAGREELFKDMFHAVSGERVIDKILQDTQSANIELDALHIRDMTGVEELSLTAPGYEPFAYDVKGSLCQCNIVLLDSGILARVPFAARRGDVVSLHRSC
jgi:hypothetical protein